MTSPLPRVVVPFSDQWADPGPDGAAYDACLEALCTPPDRLDPRQRPAAMVYRYVSEIELGGHARYFAALGRDAARLVPGTIDGLCYLGVAPAGEILARAMDRWLEYADAASEVTEQDFADLDAEYAILGVADQADHPQFVLDRYVRANTDLFIEPAPPTEADQALIALGNPNLHKDGGRAAWFSLATHASPRVRLKAAEHLLDLDRDEALRIARGVRVDPRTNPWVLSKTLRLLREAGVRFSDEA